EYGRRMRSIHRYLTRTLALVLALATVLVVIAAYLITAHETEEILDAQLGLQSRVVAGLIDPDTPLPVFRRIAERLSQPGHLAYAYRDGERADGGVEPVTRLYHHEERKLSVGFWNPNGSPRLMGPQWS